MNFRKCSSILQETLQSLQAYISCCSPVPRSYLLHFPPSFPTHDSVAQSQSSAMCLGPSRRFLSEQATGIGEPEDLRKILQVPGNARRIVRARGADLGLGIRLGSGERSSSSGVANRIRSRTVRARSVENEPGRMGGRGGLGKKKDVFFLNNETF